MIHALYHINMNNFSYGHIIKIHNFQGQKYIWTKCVQLVIKIIFIS
jgi:hypothetical protein